MNLIETLQQQVAQAVKDLYNLDFAAQEVTITPTRKEFTGDYTVVVFSFVKLARKSPPQVGEEIGQYLKEKVDFIGDFNVIQGFLNLSISDIYWVNFLQEVLQSEDYGTLPAKNKRVMVEFSSPNTNKPLHLGHIRNNLLGWATANILKKAGYDVITTQVINDRGVHICKSMLAWQRFGNGETPETAGVKGDHLVGKYYVEFDKKLKEEYKEWQRSEEGQSKYSEWKASVGFAKLKEEKEETFDFESHFFANIYKNQYFNTESQLGVAVKRMLVDWEANEEDVRQLWNTMNSWVYEGFEETYRNLGVHFDKNYYESDTYLLGKDIIEKGLETGIFYQKEDGSVWIDLTDAKLDHKLVLRSDGTSVYITQDIGMVYARYDDYKMDSLVYVVGDEQNYHFQVLFETLKRLSAPSYEGLYHLSYGMVDLPTGKMKSREGTVVDADDLMREVMELAAQESSERGTLTDFSEEIKQAIFRKIGLGALKYFILKINPKKRMVFNPHESLDLQGQTGPYIQNAYVRTRSVQRKASQEATSEPIATLPYDTLQPLEKDLLLLLQQYPETIERSATTYDPSEIATYAFTLAKTYHRFYHDLPIFRNVESEGAKHFRLQLNEAVAMVLKSSFELLGGEMPDFM